MKPALTFIGIGKVAQTLAWLWQQQGWPIAALASRDAAKAQALADELCAQALPIEEAAAQGQLVLLTVADDAIAPLVARLAALDLGWQGRAVLHTSGARSLDVLAPLAAQGAMVGSLHPAYPFADPARARVGVLGASFALEAEVDLLRGWLSALVLALDGRALWLGVGQKARYHAALCIASNYAVTLYSLAERLLLGMDAEPAAVKGALDALLAGTLANLGAQGLPWGLTGPLTRADVGTIATHLASLPAEFKPIYRDLARQTYPLLEARGVPLESIERLLREDEQR